jgi:hypothetical protein
MSVGGVRFVVRKCRGSLIQADQPTKAHSFALFPERAKNEEDAPYLA